ncbi:FecCD family ABC transporter permease [Arachnia propionica]|uniref:Ferric enterobactin transport system permease protein fepD n=1 Tax=Arachnia propionica TaxID=1750 RepID=A0A3S4W5V1_9ACTN|nr:iron ABC transporter permease [Arachnia propionica]VEH69475.1 Ferric enterobactin transport system permease protein fepD [Arachnia propionica]
MRSSTDQADTPARPGRPRFTRKRSGPLRFLAPLLAVLVLLVLITESLALGSRTLSPEEVWQGFLAYDNSVASKVVWGLRIHRTILAIVVGASLAVAGVVMQALTRNPLAEPGILGVNAGASLAVVAAIGGLGLTSVNQYLPFAFAGAAAAAVLVHMMSRRSADSGPARLVLAGVALGASLSSITGTITMYNSKIFDSYRFWVVGSLENRKLEVLLWVAPFLAVGLVLALASAHSLNALALGDEQATALGVNLAVVRGVAFVALTLLCGAATAAAGPISFIGLVIPHVVRLLVGADQKHLLAWSVVAGAGLLLAADVAGRLLIRPTELEAGIVTAFIGAPVLLVLAVTNRTNRRSA